MVALLVDSNKALYRDPQIDGLIVRHACCCCAGIVGEARRSGSVLQYSRQPHRSNGHGAGAKLRPTCQSVASICSQFSCIRNLSVCRLSFAHVPELDTFLWFFCSSQFCASYAHEWRAAHGLPSYSFRLNGLVSPTVIPRFALMSWAVELGAVSRVFFFSVCFAIIAGCVRLPIDTVCSFLVVLICNLCPLLARIRLRVRSRVWPPGRLPWCRAPATATTAGSRYALQLPS